MCSIRRSAFRAYLKYGMIDPVIKRKGLAGNAGRQTGDARCRQTEKGEEKHGKGKISQKHYIP